MYINLSDSTTNMDLFILTGLKGCSDEKSAAEIIIKEIGAFKNYKASVDLKMKIGQISFSNIVRTIYT